VLITRQQNVFAGFFRLLFHPISNRFHKDLRMLWLMTMGRRLNGVYAAFMLVAFMMGVAGALQAPTLSLFLSREVGAQPFWVGLFYTVNAIAGILVSLWLAKRSDSQGDRRKLILFCCAMAVGNACCLPLIVTI
jgi:SET family sugar efflux transporter-like MFS transporter